MARGERPSAVGESLGEAIEVPEIPKADRKGGTGKTTIGIGSEADAIPTGDRRHVLDVIQAVLDRRVAILAVEEAAEEIQSDHAVPGRDGFDLIVTKMSRIPTGDRRGVRVGRTHRTSRSVEHVVERRFGEM